MKLLRVASWIALASTIAILSGCATGVRLDTSKTAISQESRVKFLIIHYTALDMPTSLRVLTQQEVSAHYLVGDDNPTTIYRLVDESQTAYQAGLSDWKGFSRLNPSSIGIEIVNLGYQDGPNGRSYQPFPQYQIDKLIPLIKDIVARHKIKPENILGHQEIAPQRKPDPGPLFPWKQLADAGLIPWPYADQVATLQAGYEQQLPDITWFQKKLAQHGYLTPQTGVLDDATRNVLIAFQARYRPAKFDGHPDAESAAILQVLTTTAKTINKQQ
ncbi:N-acetylmuramoyl-L-alanine amidase [Undibacterium terreum]|uniref:N-acetylmuramoyl-L-alanine amidase n=1 Tax=Undibacterium terreum TaxID=1224302 RepID=A0A916U571_9BURK|nr:N-acetylmuramoyl-L-alanine amidase [Undibacterium terreum]GGC61059.1 protein AmpDh2 [Undibacterium terreum]